MHFIQVNLKSIDHQKFIIPLAYNLEFIKYKDSQLISYPNKHSKDYTDTNQMDIVDNTNWDHNSFEVKEVEL